MKTVFICLIVISLVVIITAWISLRKRKNVSKHDAESIPDEAETDGLTIEDAEIAAKIRETLASLSPSAKHKRVFHSRCKETTGSLPMMVFNDTPSTESYAKFADNRFHSPDKEPLSTFSIDVDVASYSNMRRYINQGELPPMDSVRVEEFINYFSYTYPQPTDSNPIHIDLEAGVCPWKKQHRLVKIGLKTKDIPTENLPAANFVFLIDVSGSMDEPNKLGLVKSSMKMLTNQLRAIDRVSIVVYGSNAQVVLPSTPGDEKIKIKKAIKSLSAAGYTAGEAGLRLAYQTAKENFIQGGNNRIILCSDGDFNFGVSDESGIEQLVSQKSKDGIFLSVLGFGMGNYKDSMMQVLAEKGKGNQAYIDNIQEARKVLISEFGSTLFTVAEDVKLQIEFNPVQVQSYRLVGYESRLLKDEDFNDDKKDAGDIGAGHTVTALYEIIPVGVSGTIPGTVDSLKYQKKTEQPASFDPILSEMLTVKLRYKKPGESESRLMEKSLTDTGSDNVSEDFRFASAVAMFGQLLRHSDFKGDANYQQVIDIAEQMRSNDSEGYRKEFIRLVKSAQSMA